MLIFFLLFMYIMLIANTARAAPMSNQTNVIRRRYVDTGNPSCARKIPGDIHGRTYAEKVQQAFDDALEIVNTINGDMSSSFMSSKAFSHYFLDTEWAYPEAMFSAIAWSITNVDYQITIECGSDYPKSTCRKDTLAETLSDPQRPRIRFCDLFFDPESVETKLDLDGRKFDKKGWCQKYKEFLFFSVAGLTVIHELTHLSAVGKKVGLPPRRLRNGQVVYNTRDIIDFPSSARMGGWEAARALRQSWAKYDKDNKAFQPELRTWQNAESYAGAAVEMYFEKRCSFPEILPHVQGEA